MEAVAKTPEREAFYKKIDGENLSALWNVMGDLITPEPKSACRPHLWKFDAVRARDFDDRRTHVGTSYFARCLPKKAQILSQPSIACSGR